jgi:hypothetical protein
VNWRKLTTAGVGVLLLIVIVYDVLAAVFGGYPATISKVYLDGAWERPVLAVALGVVHGHLQWPRDPATPRWRIVAGAALVLAAAAGLLLLEAPVTIVCGLVGNVLGHLTWTQPVPKESR